MRKEIIDCYLSTYVSVCVYIYTPLNLGIGVLMIDQGKINSIQSIQRALRN